MNARDKLSAARLRVRRRFPYFNAMLFALRPVAEPGCGNISVDDGLRLYYDPAMLDQLDVEEIETLVAHEVQHPLRRHSLRERAATALLTRYRRVWRQVARLFGAASFFELFNIAGDLEINDDLIVRIKMKMPREPFVGVLPSTYKLPDGLSAEDYIDLMLKRAEQAQEEQDAASGNTADEGTASQDGGEGQGDAAASGAAGEEREGEGGSSDGSSGGNAGDDASSSKPQDDPGGDGQGGGDHRPAPAAQDPAAGSGQGGAGGSGGRPDARRPRCGSGACGGAAGNAQPHEKVDRPDAPDPAKPHDVNRAVLAVAHAVLAHKGSASRGTEPGGWLTAWAREMISPPKVNPYRVLAAATRSAIASQQRGSMDFANGPQSRRRAVLTQYVGQLAPLMSVMRGPNPRVVFVVDSSGSMGHGKDSRLAAALGEVLNISRQCQATPLGLAVDAAVHDVRPVRTVDDVLALTRGGGGTDMRVGIRAAAEPKHKANLIVLVTDGETPWPKPNEMPRHATLVTVVINRQTPQKVGCPKHILSSVVHVDVDY